MCPPQIEELTVENSSLGSKIREQRQYVTQLTGQKARVHSQLKEAVSEWQHLQQELAALQEANEVQMTTQQAFFLTPAFPLTQCSHLGVLHKNCRYTPRPSSSSSSSSSFSSSIAMHRSSHLITSPKGPMRRPLAAVTFQIVIQGFR